MEYTPGPWKIGSTILHGYNYSTIVAMKDGRERYIATVDTENDQANAKLIAASPETAAERDKLKANLAEALDALQAFYWHRSSEFDGKELDTARGILTKHGRLP